MQQRARNEPRLLNHLIGEREKRRRHRDAEGFGSLEINDEFKFCWPLDGNICRLFAFQDFIDELRRPPVKLPPIGSVRQQSTSINILPVSVSSEKPKLCGQIDGLLAEAQQ